MTKRTPTLLAAIAAAALGLSGCAAAAPEPSASASASASPSASEVEIPQSELGEATTWALALMQGEADATEAEIADRFAPATIEQLGGAAALVDSFGQLQTLAPYTVLAYEEAGGVGGTRLEAGGDEYVMQVALDDAGLLTTLAVQLAPEIPEPAGSWDELTERADGLGAPVSVTVYDVTDGEVDAPTYEAGDLEGAQPSGSMFKLFVLLAVVDAIDAGTLAWDDALTLTDATRSLPSGELQLEPDGTEVSVEEAALGMISISDNTATDLLVEAVGRDAVEAQLAEVAPDGADATTPMLATRDLFLIGWGDAALRTEWAAADDAGRDALLAEVASGPLTATAVDVAVPAWQDGLDWFLSPADLARAHVALHEASETEAGEPLAEILTTNPGLDMGEWDAVAFKGGSSIGVLGGSWLLEDADATYVVVVQSATEAEGEIAAQQGALHLATDAGMLLAEE